MAFNTDGSETGLLGSYLPTRYPTEFANGWLKLKAYQYSTGQVHRLVSTDTPPVTFFGLPVIGFMANDYVNRTLQVGTRTVLSNYGAMAPHKAVRRIQ